MVETWNARDGEDYIEPRGGTRGQRWTASRSTRGKEHRVDDPERTRGGRGNCVGEGVSSCQHFVTAYVMCFGPLCDVGFVGTPAKRERSF